MPLVNAKDIPQKHNSLGQYFTPPSVVDFCLSKTKLNTELVIEPSCGIGAFVDRINREVIAIEIDKSLIREDFLNINFYDYELTKDYESITIIGNPPYHTPACSLVDGPYNRKEYVRGLAKKYDVTGIREEAVFFILKSFDLIGDREGHIYFILPKTIFSNNSRSYKTFINFLKKRMRLAEVWDIGREFEHVTTDLCYVHFVVGETSDKFLLNGEETLVDNFYGVNEDVITFHNIFKKTYLGSVPCESVLLSIRDEPLGHFKERLCRVANGEFDLTYNGNYHLRAMRDPKKVEIVKKYIEEIRNLVPGEQFSDDNCYKPIRHRNEDRWYYRNNLLKKASFVYQLNPNPCPSFYFPGNPAKGCLDYHGFCNFDVNRNCSPSANRTVPIDGNNLTEEFKVYWQANTNLSYDCVFDYLSFVLKSDWYKMMKNKYQRWYFGVPREFMKGFICSV